MVRVVVVATAERTLLGKAEETAQLELQTGVLTQVVSKAITHKVLLAVPLPWVTVKELSLPAMLAAALAEGQDEVLAVVSAVLCMARWVSPETRMVSPISIWLLEVPVNCVRVL